MSNVNVNRAIAMALAGNYKIGGDGEMMVQEEIFATDSSTGIYEKGSTIPLTKKYTDYDLIEIHCNYFSHLFSVKSIKEHTNNEGGIILEQIWAHQTNVNYQLSFYLVFSDELITIADIRGTGATGIYGIKKIYGIKFTGTKSIDYSEAEQVIGKWIDGKPLYQKTVKIGEITIPKNTMIQKTVSDYIDNIKYIIDATAVIDNGAGYNKLPTTFVDSTYSIYSIDFACGDGMFYFSRGNSHNVTISPIITVQYTKTTD